MRVNWRLLASLVAVLALFATACGSNGEGASGDTDADAGGGDTAAETEPAEEEAPAETEGDDTGGDEQVSGAIEIDGSSTVGPLTDAISEEYASAQPDVQVNLAISGTGGGFERFCGEGSTDISNASRPIKEEEAELCGENGIDFTEVRVGTDALTMVTNPQSEGIDCLTTEELTQIWGEGASNWSEVNAEFPDEPITIFAPDTDSGTYDFFTETILGEDADVIQDYNASADDNIIAQGIQGTPYSWGYFGFAYFVNNQEGLKAISYDAGDGCVEPSVETAQDDSYKLSRPLFIYVKDSAVQEKPQVADFVSFYLETVNDVIDSVGYIAAPDPIIETARCRVDALIAGDDPDAACPGSEESAS